MKLDHLLPLITVVFFTIALFFIKNPRPFYIFFVLFLIPVMDLPITTSSWGSLRVFDGLAYISFIIFFKDFYLVKKAYLFYYILSGLLIFFLILGSITSIFPRNSFVSLLSIPPIFIFSKLLIAECSKDLHFQKKVITSLKIIAIISIIFLGLQMLVGLKFTFYTSLNRNTLDYRGNRYPSYFHDPQKYELFLAMLSFLFLINFKQLAKPNFKNYLLFFILLIAMLATGGRSPFIGLFIGMLFLFYFLGTRYKIILIFTFLLSSVLLIYHSDSLLILKRSGNFNEDYLYRAALWKEAYNIFITHPALGIGFGNFHEYAMTFSDNYFITPDNDVVFFEQPESGYWMMLTEIGILGFISSFILVLVPIFQQIIRYFKKKSSVLGLFFIAALITWLISFVSLYSIADKRILILVITLVCLLFTKNTTNHDHASNPQ
jgi:O-antigen ligase